MAYPTQLTIGTGQKVGIRYGSSDSDPQVGQVHEECFIVVTFELEDDDEHLLEVVAEKAPEVERAHAMAQSRIRNLRAERRDTQPSRSQIDREPVVQEDGANGACGVRSFEPGSPGPNVKGESSQANGSEARYITGPQRLAIEEKFQRLGLTMVDITNKLTSRYNKPRLGQLSEPEARDLLKHLQALTASPASPNQYPPPSAPEVSTNGHRPPQRRLRR